MAFECEDCGMEFDTPNEKQNHKQKFCVHSKYGNADALEKRMEELKRIEHDLDYNYQQKNKPAGPSSMKSAGMGVVGLKNDQRLPSPYREKSKAE